MISDSDIDRFLGGNTTTASSGASSADIDRFLSGSTTTTTAGTDSFLSGTSETPELPPPTAGEIAGKGAISAATTAYGMSGPAITPKQAYDVFGRPVVEAAGKTYEKYVKGGLFKGGRPPLPTLDIAKEAAPGIVSAAQKITSVGPGVGTAYEYYPIRDYMRQIDPDLYNNKLKPAFDRAGAQGVKDLLESDDKTIRRLMRDPKFAELAGAFTGKVPSGMSQLGRGLGALGRTAARVAGPVGLVSTAYDIYQAAPYAARMLQTGVAGRQGQLGQTADEMPMVTGPVEPNYIDEIKRRAAEKALGR